MKRLVFGLMVAVALLFTATTAEAHGRRSFLRGHYHVPAFRAYHVAPIYSAPIYTQPICQPYVPPVVDPCAYHVAPFATYGYTQPFYGYGGLRFR